MAQNLPVSQFYHVSTDNKDPYQVYGGLQDNSAWVGDQEYPGGITNSRWENLFGGDGFWAFSDPSDANYAYAESQGGHIGAHQPQDARAARYPAARRSYKEKLRFNWNTPIALSPNEKGTIYIGSQFLFRSRDHGVTWDRISPDLTTNDPIRQRQEQSGGITVDNSFGRDEHDDLFDLGEPASGGADLGRNRRRQRPAHARRRQELDQSDAPIFGMPQGNWISWVEASRYDPAVAYVTDDRHTYGDMQPYLYRTTDYGRTWQRLIGPGTPGVRGYAHVIKEDRLNPNILYLGTEFGLFISVERRRSWAQFKPNNFPDGLAVRDIASRIATTISCLRPTAAASG